MAKFQTFYDVIKRQNPPMHYIAVLEELDKLSENFVSALQLAEYLKERNAEFEKVNVLDYLTELGFVEDEDYPGRYWCLFADDTRRLEVYYPSKFEYCDSVVVFNRYNECIGLQINSFQELKSLIKILQR